MALIPLRGVLLLPQLAPRTANQWNNHAREACQTAAGASAERPHWRNVRTAQDSVAANGCPPRGEDQSNRDESERPRDGVFYGTRRKPEPGGANQPVQTQVCSDIATQSGGTPLWVKRAISTRSNTK